MDEHFWSFKITLLIVTVLCDPALAIDKRSVNVALETTFLIDPQDVQGNTSFIKNVHNVINQLRRAFVPNDPAFRREERREDEAVLTTFLTEIGSSLIQFSDDDIRKFIEDLNEVVQKETKNKYFKEIVKDNRLRTFVKNVVKKWVDTYPSKQKVLIANSLNNADTDTVILGLFSIMNKVFDSSDEPKFKKLLKKFTEAKETKNFAKFQSETLNFVVFKRYKKLNVLLKMVVREELKKFAQYVSEHYGSYIDTDVTHNPRRALINVAQPQVDPHTDYSSGEIHRKTESNNREKTRKNETVIDKDLAVNVHAEENSNIALKIN